MLATPTVIKSIAIIDKPDPFKHAKLDVDPHNLRSYEVGDFPWDRWETQAKAAGVIDDLVQLGRSLMREAVQHTWDDNLQKECGWSDNGAAMIQLALSDPEAARKRWNHLMQTDGERGSYDESGQWVPD